MIVFAGIFLRAEKVFLFFATQKLSDYSRIFRATKSYCENLFLQAEQQETCGNSPTQASLANDFPRVFGIGIPALFRYKVEGIIAKQNQLGGSGPNVSQNEDFQKNEKNTHKKTGGRAGGFSKHFDKLKNFEKQSAILSFLTTA